MRQLEQEYQRLKKLVTDLSIDKAMLQDVLAKKKLTLARLREGVRNLQMPEANLSRPSFIFSESSILQRAIVLECLF